MNSVLSEYTENPIIDRLVQWPPSTNKINRIRASSPVLRNPFIEIEFNDGTVDQYVFNKTGFAQFWAEAMVILGEITSIELNSDVRYQPNIDQSNLLGEVRRVREEAIESSRKMYAAGMYRVFLDQFGENCKGLPVEVLEMLSNAKENYF